MDPHARAERFLSETRDHGQQQEEQGEGTEGVGVATQHAVIAQRDENDRGDDDRDTDEEGLAEADHGLAPARVGQVQAIDHRQSQPRQGHGDRQDHRVRVGGEEAHADLADDGQGEEHANLREEIRGDRARVVEGRERVSGDAHEQGQPHEDQLQEEARPGGRD